ncbi:MurR/RpiR family transcriptional regulator [Aerococcaceae bacterium DSM 111020]|nr:MurR/RpiR family transcriptional regulator [Aerococcaceae bacterium DSM 111020]
MNNNMNILHVLKNLKPNGTKSEEKIIETILENPQKILNMTAMELGEVSLTSAASVIRLSKKVGLTGFPQLKLLISKSSNAIQPDKYSDIKQDANVETVKKVLFNNIQQTLNETMELVDEEKIQKVVQEIHETHVIYIFGIGSSYLSALNFSQKFNRIGKLVITQHDCHSLIASMASQNDESLFIGVSNTGETNEVIELLTLANDLQMKTTALTQFGSNTLAKISDIAIQHAYPEEPIVRSSASSSLHAQFYIIDLLFHSYASKYYDEIVKPLDQTYKYIKKYKEGE